MPYNRFHMKRMIALTAVITALTITGCSSVGNELNKAGADWSNRPATVTCYSGGKEVYKTVTHGKVIAHPLTERKVTTGNGDMATFQDSSGHLVEMYADCFYEYNNPQP